MENYAALITAATPMRALPLPLTQNEPATVATRILQLPSRVAAVFLIGLEMPAVDGGAERIATGPTHSTTVHQE